MCPISHNPQIADACVALRVSCHFAAKRVCFACVQAHSGIRVKRILTVKMPQKRAKPLEAAHTTVKTGAYHKKMRLFSLTLPSHILQLKLEISHSS